MHEVKDIKDRTPNNATVKMLEGLLEDARKGDVRSIVLIAGWDNDSVSHSWSIDNRNTLRRLLSEIVLLQHDFTVNLEFTENDTVLSRAFEID